MGSSWAPKPLCLCFLFAGKMLQPPKTFLNTKEQIQRVANQGSEGMQKQRRNHQATVVQLLKQDPSSSRDIHNNIFGGFPGGTVVENLPANAGDTGSSPGLGRSHMLQSNWAR